MSKGNKGRPRGHGLSSLGVKQDTFSYNPPPRQTLVRERPWQIGKVEQRPPGKNIYLDQSVADLGREGYSNVFEITRTLQRIEQDFRRGAIDRNKLNLRLIALALQVKRSNKGELGTKVGQYRAIYRINVIRERHSLKPLSTKVYVNKNVFGQSQVPASVQTSAGGEISAADVQSAQEIVKEEKDIKIEDMGDLQELEYRQAEKAGNIIGAGFGVPGLGSMFVATEGIPLSNAWLLKESVKANKELEKTGVYKSPFFSLGEGKTGYMTVKLEGQGRVYRIHSKDGTIKKEIKISNKAIDKLDRIKTKEKAT